MTSVMLLLTASIITEGVTEWLKEAFPSLKQQTTAIYLVTAVIGVGIAILTGADIFGVLGIKTVIPVVGQILTGVLCSRGSNYVYDLMRKIRDHEGSAAEIEPHGFEEEGRG